MGAEKVSLTEAAELAIAEAWQAFSSSTSTEGSLRMREAQVHATLALVEQQRIANLIAVLGHRDIFSPEPIANTGWLGDDKQRAELNNSIRATIRQGLGL